MKLTDLFVVRSFQPREQAPASTGEDVYGDGTSPPSPLVRIAPPSDFPKFGRFLTNEQTRRLCLFVYLFVCKGRAGFPLAIELRAAAESSAPGDRGGDVELRKYYRCYCGVWELILLPSPPSSFPELFPSLPR